MIIAGMATMPDRLLYLEEVVETIRPQVDVLRVYLNNFVDVPGFLRAGEAALSNTARGDLGAEGKFYWIDGKDGLGDYTHYLTIDDDLGYPRDYVSTLVDEFDARGAKAIVGVHGSEFDDPLEDFVTSRKERYRFYEALGSAKSVHLLGTATTILSRETIRLDLDNNFPLRNASDLQLAVAAQNQQVPMIAIARTENWITEKRPWTAEGISIWKSTKAEGHSAVKTELAKTAVSQWVLYPDPIAQ